MQTTEQKTKSFDPDKSLLSLGIVKCTILATVVTSLFIHGVIAWTSNLELNLTYEGFNNFLKFFQFPIGVLGLNIPLIALYGANHRSEQTKKQISINAEQNHFSNKFKHLEEFEKYNKKYNDFLNPDVEDNKTETKKYFAYIEEKNAREAYSKIFGESPNQNFEIQKSIPLDIEKAIDAFYGCLSQLTSHRFTSHRDEKQIKDILAEFTHSRLQLFREYSISTKNLKETYLDKQGINKPPFDNLSHFVNNVREGIVLIIHLCKFDYRFKSSPNMERIMQEDLTNIKGLISNAFELDEINIPTKFNPK